MSLRRLLCRRTLLVAGAREVQDIAARLIRAGEVEIVGDNVNLAEGISDGGVLGGKDRNDDCRNARDVHHGKDPEVASRRKNRSRPGRGSGRRSWGSRIVRSMRSRSATAGLSASELGVLLLPGCVCAMRVLAVLFAQRDQRV